MNLNIFVPKIVQCTFFFIINEVTIAVIAIKTRLKNFHSYSCQISDNDDFMVGMRFIANSQNSSQQAMSIKGLLRLEFQVTHPI